MKILNCLGKVLCSFGYLVLIIAGIWGFWIELVIVHEAAGFWGMVIAFSILPLTYIAVPFYALIANGNWFPLALVYGGGLIGAAIFGTGQLIVESVQVEDCEKGNLDEEGDE
jgi:hypothetical protein